MEDVMLFYERCRLCLEKLGVIKIFETENLSDDIFCCIGVKVLSTDNLPQKMCLRCFETVNSAKQLRILAMQNDSHLRSLFASDEEDDDPVVLTGHPGYSLVASCSKDYLVNYNQNIGTDKIDSNDDKKPGISIRKDIFGSSEIVTSSETLEDTSKKKRPMTDNGDLECEECGKGFETRKKLYLHKRQHSKTVSCPLDACGKMFATKSDLRKHIRSHTGDRPYVCDMCDKKFTQNGTLKQHKEHVHGL